jgi:hypothetical protein
VSLHTAIQDMVTKAEKRAQDRADSGRPQVPAHVEVKHLAALLEAHPEPTTQPAHGILGPGRPAAVAVADSTVERYCEVMHDAYEAAATRAGWETQQASRKPWADVPEANKATMRAAVRALLAEVERPRPRLDLASLQDRIATAIGDPGSVVGRQHHLNESVPRWATRAVMHVLAEHDTVPVALDPADVHTALLAVWLERADQKTVASPEEHCSALVAAVMALAVDAREVRAQALEDAAHGYIDPESVGADLQASTHEEYVRKWLENHAKTARQKADVTPVDVVARSVLAAILSDDEDRWEDYPEIGEHDWIAVMDRVRAIAEAVTAHVDPNAFQQAYQTLAARADS